MQSRSSWIRSMSPFMIASAILGLALFAFLAWPVVNLVLSSWGGLIPALARPEVRSAILTSILAATLSTLIALVLGVPLAYVLSRYEFRAKAAVESMIDLPLLIPHTAAGIAILSLFGAGGPVGSLLSPLGIRFTDTLLGIVLAMLFVSAPFVVKPAKEAFDAVRPSLEMVARSLGASRFQTFFLVTLPLTYRAILTGSILAWARAISEFGAVIIMAYRPVTAPVLIYTEFLGWGLVRAMPIAALLVLISLLALVCLRLVGPKPLPK